MVRASATRTWSTYLAYRWISRSAPQSEISVENESFFELSRKELTHLYPPHNFLWRALSPQTILHHRMEYNYGASGHTLINLLFSEPNSNINHPPTDHGVKNISPYNNTGKRESSRLNLIPPLSPRNSTINPAKNAALYVITLTPIPRNHSTSLHATQKFSNPISRLTHACTSRSQLLHALLNLNRKKSRYHHHVPRPSTLCNLTAA